MSSSSIILSTIEEEKNMYIYNERNKRGRKKIGWNEMERKGKKTKIAPGF